MGKENGSKSERNKNSYFVLQLFVAILFDNGYLTNNKDFDAH